MYVDGDIPAAMTRYMFTKSLLDGDYDVYILWACQGESQGHHNWSRHTMPPIGQTQNPCQLYERSCILKASAEPFWVESSLYAAAHRLWHMRTRRLD